MKGDLADLQNSLLGTADHNLQALTHVEAALIPVEAVDEIAFKRPAIGRAMWYETLVDASIFREWTLNVGRRDARTRAAHLLCEFALRLEVAGH
jgi:CRP-like cAMP-binding protein